MSNAGNTARYNNTCGIEFDCRVLGAYPGGGRDERLVEVNDAGHQWNGKRMAVLARHLAPCEGASA